MGEGCCLPMCNSPTVILALLRLKLRIQHNIHVSHGTAGYSKRGERRARGGGEGTVRWVRAVVCPCVTHPPSYSPY